MEYKLDVWFDPDDITEEKDLYFIANEGDYNETFGKISYDEARTIYEYLHKHFKEESK